MNDRRRHLIVLALVLAVLGGAVAAIATKPTKLGLDLQGGVGAPATLAGYLLQRLGRVPSPGESVRAGSLCFEVLDTDGPRIRAVRIVREEAG